MTAVLEVLHATKTFPGVRALDDVSVEVRANEVVGLIGENGAGKSTLLKVLTGVYRLDEGQVRVNGREVHLQSSRDAFDHGVAMVFQEQSVLTTMTVAENIFLGREREFTRFGILNKKAMHAAARVELDKVHLDVDPGTLCAQLSFADRQMVEIAKALSLDSRVEGDIVILLDEPTSVLESREVKLLFDIVRDLKSRAAFVFISHRLDEVLDLSDRVYIMRDGALVGEMPAAAATLQQMHQLMVGRALHHEYYREHLQAEPAEAIAVAARSISSPAGFSDVSFELRHGEILGVAGVIGSGREALARAISGLAPISAGELLIEGQAVRFRGSRDAVRHGVGYVPRERKLEGIVNNIPVFENMTLSALQRFTRNGVLQGGEEHRVAREWIERLSIKTPSDRTFAGSLSGGNQQKVVLSKWLIAGTRVIVLDHPTRGVDVGAKEEVYDLIREMTADGVAVILLGDTLEEVIGLSHKIIVMKDGRITDRFDAAVGHKPDQLDLIRHMV